jgi:D-galacturonate reductase
MCGTSGVKMPAIRAHMQRVLGDVYSGINPSGIETWPADGVVDRAAYKTAVEQFGPGDCAIIFTPDDTHSDIAAACLARGMHVQITKPPVKTLAAHRALADAAAAAGRLCVVEVHKRFDPIYADARDRIVGLGDFSCAQRQQSNTYLYTGVGRVELAISCSGG